MRLVPSAGENIGEIPLNAVDAHVGARLRARRLFLQMSEKWLVGHLQISERHLCDLEEGRARIGFQMQLELCRLLDVADRYFYMGFGKSAPPPAPPEKKSWLRDVDRWFRDHVSPHEGLFLSVAKRMTGNLDAARDLVHDAYAAVLSDDRWRTVENPRAYVRRAVTNIAVDKLRRKKVVQIDDFSDADFFNHRDASPDAFQAVAGREELRMVLEALDKLPKQCRRVFTMRKIEDISPIEIARRLGLDIKTVENHLARGILALNRHLEAAESAKQEAMTARTTSDVSSRSAAELGQKDTAR